LLRPTGSGPKSTVRTRRAALATKVTGQGTVTVDAHRRHEDELVLAGVI
jgi:hypothetical protein